MLTCLGTLPLTAALASAECTRDLLILLLMRQSVISALFSSSPCRLWMPQSSGTSHACWHRQRDCLPIRVLRLPHTCSLGVLTTAGRRHQLCASASPPASALHQQPCCVSGLAELATSYLSDSPQPWRSHHRVTFPAGRANGARLWQLALGGLCCV